MSADREAAWQEGFDAGYEMARWWGHVDNWQDWPENPYSEKATDEG